ncbi:class I SAM-dependent methyltransferase [Psychromonas aquimarina]|uniref:class I SAM-dependent methyltransferase n=1 Tax=Psychromonas aquimarina TaxID=444919 RepID=UPI00048C9244|nr:class I SAM-dependent methyltransferase [Psychromonas aquimarina]
MYKELKNLNQKPEVFQSYTADSLWTDPHRAEQMLSYHLNSDIEAASRNTEFIDKSVSWMIKHFELSCESKVGDFGCGPGLYSSRFAKENINITGIDFSKNSTDYAQRYAQDNNLTVEYINQNYLEYSEVEKYDLTIMIMCDFCALSPAQRKQMLTVLYNSLKKGGKLIIDVYSLAAFAARKESALYERDQLFGFWSKKDYFAFVNIFKYENEKVVLDKYTIFEENDESYTVYNWLQYFSPRSLAVEFEQAGFSVLEYFADVAGSNFSESNAEFAIVAEKSTL